MRVYVRTLLISVVALVILGTILVFSASGTYSFFNYDDFYYLFKSHLGKVVIAIFAFAVAVLVPYEYYKKYSKWLLLGTIFILILTPFFGTEINGARRWISFGLFPFQPAEVAKLILLMHLSTLIVNKGELIRDFNAGFKYPLIWIFIVAGLIIIQPNVSTSVIVVLISFALLFVAGAQIKHIAGTLGVLGLSAASVMMIFSHSRARILTFIDSLMNNGDINIQVKQAKIALGSGGWLGVGLGHSRQSDLFLPESYGDFIFSILGEEIGLAGTLSILLAYFVIFFVCIIIAKKSDDSFAQLLAFGLAFNIIFSAFVNAAVVVGVLPTTGITLPFISFGGTSIIILSYSIGIIINIAHNTIKKQQLVVNPA